MTYKEQLKELLFDDEEILQDIILKVEPLLQINKTNGVIKFKIPAKILTDKQNILLYIVGARFAHDLGLREKPEVSNQELIDFTGKTKDTISSRLSELKRKKKLCSSERGRFFINPVEITEDINNISTTFKKNKDKG